MSQVMDANLPFKDNKLKQDGSTNKHSSQLMCVDNLMLYNKILEVEEQKRNLIKEEQIKIQK